MGDISLKRIPQNRDCSHAGNVFQPVIWNTIKDKDVQLHYHILAIEEQQTENYRQEVQNRNQPCVQDTGSQPDRVVLSP